MLNETMPIPSVISSLNTSLAILCSRWLLAVELPWMGHCQVNGISHTCRIWLHRVFLTVYSNDWRDSFQPPARLKRHTKKKKKQSMLKVVHTMLILWTVYVQLFLVEASSCIPAHFFRAWVLHHSLERWAVHPEFNPWMPVVSTVSW